jgi:hypothetical protein
MQRRALSATPDQGVRRVQPCLQHVKNLDLLSIEGHLREDIWEDSQGRKRGAIKASEPLATTRAAPCALRPAVRSRISPPAPAAGSHPSGPRRAANPQRR